MIQEHFCITFTSSLESSLLFDLYQEHMNLSAGVEAQIKVEGMNDKNWSCMVKRIQRNIKVAWKNTSTRQRRHERLQAQVCPKSQICL